MALRVVAALVLLVSGCAAGVEDPDALRGAAVTDGPADSARVDRIGSGTSTSTKKSGELAAEPTGGPLFRASADSPIPSMSLNSFDRYEAAIESDGTLTIARGKGVAGTDPQPSGYAGGSFYNGGTYRHAAVGSPVWRTAKPFASVTPSFEALTPKGTWLEVKIAAHVVATGQWTKEYSLGVWAYDDSTVRRHSVAGQGDADADVATDTLTLKSPADAFYVNVFLFSGDDVSTPVVRAVSAITTSIEAAPKTAAGNAATWGKTLDVPKRAQTVDGWDSPTSTAMLLGFWGITEPVSDAASLCRDVVQDSAANRPFNTAHAAAIDDGKMHAMVTRLWSFAEVEPLVAAGIPVAINVAYGEGELTSAPVASAPASDGGRVLVVKGFSSDGNVVVNDPAFASDDAVETTYDRAELAAAWRRANGATYVVWPIGKTLPADPLGAY